MYKVISKAGLVLNLCLTLDEAMTFAKAVGTFVIIRGSNFEACGHFGVDSIKDGVCPDGTMYTWMKRRRQ